MSQGTEAGSGTKEVIVSGGTGAGSDTKQVDWMMEEYKALRAEILANQDYQKSLLLFGTTVLATALGFLYRGNDFASNRGILLLLTEVLAVSFWHAFQRLAMSTEEIGTYILFRMETISTLNWETFQRVEKLKRSTETHKAGIGEQPKPQDPSKPTWRNKKSILRRAIDSLSQSPFFIFAAICCVLIFREGNSLESMALFGASLAIILGMIVSFTISIVKSMHPKVLRDKTEQQLDLSAHYREDNHFCKLPELDRFNVTEKK